MSETPPPTNGRPGYKDIYDAVNGLRAELKAEVAASEGRILAELKSSEIRRVEAMAEMKNDIRADLEDERDARELLGKTVTEIRDRVLGAAAVIAVAIFLANWFGPLLVKDLLGG